MAKPPHLLRLPPAFHDRLAALPPEKRMNGCFATYDDLGNPDCTCCKCCGETIQTWVPIADPVRRRVEGTGTVIQEVRTGFRKVHAHASLEIEMEDRPAKVAEDGTVLAPAVLSKHVSAFCRGCAAEIGEANMEAVYLADLEQAAYTDHRRGVSVDAVRHVYEFMAKRRPLRVLGFEQELG